MSRQVDRREAVSDPDATVNGKQLSAALSVEPQGISGIGTQLKMVESMPMQQFLAFTQGSIAAEMLDQLMQLSASPTAQ